MFRRKNRTPEERQDRRAARKRLLSVAAHVALTCGPELVRALSDGKLTATELVSLLRCFERAVTGECVCEDSQVVIYARTPNADPTR